MADYQQNRPYEKSKVSATLEKIKTICRVVFTYFLYSSLMKLVVSFFLNIKNYFDQSYQ